MNKGDVSMNYIIAIIISLIVLIIILIVFNESISQFVQKIGDIIAGIWTLKPDIQ